MEGRVIWTKTRWTQKIPRCGSEASGALRVQSNRRPSTNAQTTVRSDYKPMEHKFKKADRKNKTDPALRESLLLKVW